MTRLPMTLYYIQWCKRKVSSFVHTYVVFDVIVYVSPNAAVSVSTFTWVYVHIKPWRDLRCNATCCYAIYGGGLRFLASTRVLILISLTKCLMSKCNFRCSRRIFWFVRSSYTWSICYKKINVDNLILKPSYAFSPNRTQERLDSGRCIGCLVIAR